MMDGSDLYELFANQAEHADIAKQDLASLTAGIAELRADTYNPETGGGCDIDMTDAGIAEAIRDYARDHMALLGDCGDFDGRGVKGEAAFLSVSTGFAHEVYFECNARQIYLEKDEVQEIVKLLNAWLAPGTLW